MPVTWDLEERIYWREEKGGKWRKCTFNSNSPGRSFYPDSHPIISNGIAYTKPRKHHRMHSSMLSDQCKITNHQPKADSRFHLNLTIQKTPDSAILSNKTTRRSATHSTLSEAKVCFVVRNDISHAMMRCGDPKEAEDLWKVAYRFCLPVVHIGYQNNRHLVNLCTDFKIHHLGHASFPIQDAMTNHLPCLAEPTDRDANMILNLSRVEHTQKASSNHSNCLTGCDAKDLKSRWTVIPWRTLYLWIGNLFR